MQQIINLRNDKKKSPKNKFWNLSIWRIMYQTMVREIAVRWNQIEASTKLMYRKLMKLGFMNEDGEIVCIKTYLDYL